jgi:hypothetical protein
MSVDKVALAKSMQPKNAAERRLGKKIQKMETAIKGLYDFREFAICEINDLKKKIEDISSKLRDCDNKEE